MNAERCKLLVHKRYPLGLSDESCLSTARVCVVIGILACAVTAIDGPNAEMSYYKQAPSLYIGSKCTHVLTANVNTAFSCANMTRVA